MKLSLNNSVNSKESKDFVFSNKINETYIPWEAKKRFGIAVGELMIVELIPWLLSRYILTFPDSTLNWTKVAATIVFDDKLFL